VRLTRVHVDAPLAPGALLELPAGAAQHLTRVLRLAAGAQVTLFNGRGGEHEASIESTQRGKVIVRTGAHHAVERESPLQVTLMQGIARGEKMDFILQKATELGVTRIVPLSSVRCTVRLTGDTAARKLAHWQGVVASACEQCGRNRVPAVAAPASLADTLREVAGLKLLLSADDAAQPLPALLALHGTPSGLAPVTLLIGPEGGLDSGEIRAAQLAGFVACQLGPRILRTETAGLAALAALQSLAGDFNRSG
jgi:16S rRNA (uracil1498-N3)-methyltransferase